MTFNLGAFAGGIANGMALGKQIKSAMDEDEVAKLRAQGIAEAKAMQADGAPPVVDNAAPAPAADVAAAPAGGPMTVADGSGPAQVQSFPVDVPQRLDVDNALPSVTPDKIPAPAGGVSVAGGKRYRVGETSFDSADEAHAHAAKLAPSFDEAINKTLVPKMKELYLARGDTDKADAWDRWAQDAESKRGMKTWAEAFKMNQSGDYMGSARQLLKLYPSFKDGGEVVSAEPYKDAAGVEQGFNMVVRKDGKETTHQVDAKSMSTLGVAQMNPEKMFAMDYDQQTKVATLQAKEAIDARNDGRTAQRAAAAQAAADRKARALEADKANAAIELEKVKHNNRKDELTLEGQIDEAGYTAKEVAKQKTAVSSLREAGLSDDDIKAVTIAKYTGGEYKKATSPKERRDMAVTELIKNPIFIASNPEKQATMKANVLKLYEDDTAPPKPATPKPAAAGGVVRTGGAAGGGGVPVWDPKTKTMIVR